MKYAYFYYTKLGRILIAEDGLGITHLSLIKDKEETIDNKQFVGYEWKETQLIREAADQLLQYLEGNRKDFTVMLNPKGTEFQRKVWEELKKIPYGETRSYKQIAEAVGNAKASRAIGMANHNNLIICIIPCHRVIGADKSLVGYGAGLDVKKYLLELEKAI